MNLQQKQLTSILDCVLGVKMNNSEYREITKEQAIRDEVKDLMNRPDEIAEIIVELKDELTDLYSGRRNGDFTGYSFIIMVGDKIRERATATIEHYNLREADDEVICYEARSGH